MSDTQTLSPLPETVVAEPEATPEGAASEEPTPATEAEAGLLEEAPKEAPSHPWSAIDDPRDILDLDDVKPHLERRERRIREEVEREAQVQTAQKVQNWEATNLYQTFSGIWGRLRDSIDSGQTDATDRQIERLNELIEPYKQVVQDGLRREGRESASGEFYNLLLTRLSRREQEDFEDANFKGARGDKLLDIYDDIRIAPLKEQIKSLEARVKDAEGAARAKLRGEQGGPSLAPGNAGGGKSYSQMTREERNALSPEQRDALVAREIGA